MRKSFSEKQKGKSRIGSLFSRKTSVLQFPHNLRRQREVGGRALPFVRPEKRELLRSLKGIGVSRTSVPFLQEVFRYFRVVFSRYFCRP